MQRRHPIAWDCTTDEVREKIYNGMAEELDWTWKEIERLRAALTNLVMARYDANALAGGNEYHSAWSLARAILNEQTVATTKEK